jgi:ELWxxDGT repeat protein
LDPHELTSVGHILFFAATDGVHGQELWRSDGTGAGTKLVRDIAPGGANAYPGELTNVGGTLLFTADDGIHGYELWRSDGTAAGTQMVVDIGPPGGPDGAGSDPRELTEVGGTLFFVVLSEGAGSPFGDNLDELWRSDGTAAGTKLVRRVGPDPTDPAYPLRWWPPSELTSVGSTLFFEVSDDTHGIEPWRSDGTAAGTRLVRDIYPGLNPIRGSRNNPAPPRELTNVAGMLYFTAYEPTHGYELWRSDGTWKGTRIVRDILPGSQPDPKTRTPEEFTAVGRTLFFVADDGVHGRELWRSNGTAAGTRMVRDIAPDSGFLRMPRQLANIAGRLFFNADDGLNGRELWRATP